MANVHARAGVQCLMWGPVSAARISVRRFGARGAWGGTGAKLDRQLAPGPGFPA
jgi:hypothetical protein